MWIFHLCPDPFIIAFIFKFELNSKDAKNDAVRILSFKKERGLEVING